MSIKHIEILTTNPHFYALVIKGFLSGYKEPCEMRYVFMALPILLYRESREKLLTATSKSRMDTLFETAREIEGEHICGKTRLVGYIARYNKFKSYCKEAIIILSSLGEIGIRENKIELKQNKSYTKYEGMVRDWMRSAYYLGLVFSKATHEELSYYLGVEI